MWLTSIILTLLFFVGVVLFIFALIGIERVYSDYKESKWQKEHGDKLDELKEEAERDEWKKIEQLRDKSFLFEETIKTNGLESHIDKIDGIITVLNYDARYDNHKRAEAKYRLYSFSSMSGGFGSSEKAQAEIQEDFEKYEKQREQELRKKLDEI